MATLKDILARHNRQYGMPPVGSALYDAWPDFAKSLRAVARQFLSSPEYVPSLLGRDGGIDPLYSNGAISSFHEFWTTLPDEFNGRLTFEESDLLPLFCGLADPARFGTVPGRYPDQLQSIRDFLRDTGINCPDILDVGCGIGLGTLELAKELRANLALGITPEPLEIKMARDRFLPHDGRRSAMYAQFADIQAEFAVGSVTDFATDHKFHVITCNGLIGGPIVHGDREMNAFLVNCRRHLLPGGRIFCANSFHEGHRPAVERLMKMAHAIGDWQNWTA